MMARVRGVILASTSAGSIVYVSSISANTGTQFCSNAPMIVPPAVHGVTITSSPGSGLIAPIHTCIAAVPDVTAIACLTPWRAANARSNASTLGPLPTCPDRTTAVSAAISSSPNTCPGPNGSERTGAPPSIANRPLIPRLPHRPPDARRSSHPLARRSPGSRSRCPPCPRTPVHHLCGLVTPRGRGRKNRPAFVDEARSCRGLRRESSQLADPRAGGRGGWWVEARRWWGRRIGGRGLLRAPFGRRGRSSRRPGGAWREREGRLRRFAG